ncbi:MAG: LptA/OstA family protein [Chthoniobacteraceae bacterium]
MMRFASSLVFAAALTAGALAQEAGTAAAPSASPKPAKAKKDANAAPSGPTIITTDQEATFDEKAHVAIFTGKVKVVSPQFTLTCKKLTAYLNSDNGDKTASASPTPKASATPDASPAKGKAAANPADDTPGGGLDHAVAEGDVVIVEQKPATNGNQPEVDIGKAAKAKFNNKTGEMVLYGWPQLQQGINTHIALAESTVMTLTKDGHLKTDGPSRTVIQDQPDQPTPTPTPSAAGSPLRTLE